MSERLTTFLKTVEAFADEKCDAVRESTQKFKDESISAYRREAEKQTESYIEYETGRILSRVNREISDYEAEKKTALTKHRSSVTEKIFDEVKEKLSAFASSDEYIGFLKNSALNLKKAMNSETLTFYLRPADMKLADAVKAAVPEASLEADESIMLGGLRAVDHISGISGDDTLDSRLEESRRSFAEKADLKIY